MKVKMFNLFLKRNGEIVQFNEFPLVWPDVLDLEHAIKKSGIESIDMNSIDIQFACYGEV